MTVTEVNDSIGSKTQQKHPLRVGSATDELIPKTSDEKRRQVLRKVPVISIKGSSQETRSVPHNSTEEQSQGH